MCRVKHDPEDNKYGDCVRACVATVMDVDADNVPHFYYDNDPEAGLQRMATWLEMRHHAPFFSHYSGELPLDAVLNMMNEQNPFAVYILFGATESGQHVVVCRGGKIVHDPAWLPMPIIRPGDHGVWSVLVIAKS